MRIEDFSFLTSEIVGRKKERVEERTEKWSGMCILVSPFVGSDLGEWRWVTQAR